MKHIDVLFTPAELPEIIPSNNDVLFVVIDVIRASTTLTVLGEYGLQAACLATSVPYALQLQPSKPDWLLIGEENGARPSGFDFGNSPSAIANGHINGRSAIFVTTNGTKTIRACQQNPSSQIIVASLRNRAAVVRYILEHKYDECVLVCAGRKDRVAIDDAVTAGHLVAHLVQQADKNKTPLALEEGAAMSLALAESYQDTVSALHQSEAGKAVYRLGLEADLDWCTGEDIAEYIPIVTNTITTDDLPEIRFLHYKMNKTP